MLFEDLDLDVARVGGDLAQTADGALGDAYPTRVGLNEEDLI